MAKAQNKTVETKESVAAFLNAITDETKRKDYGHNGYHKIMQQFIWPVITKKYRDAYLLGIENFKKINSSKY